MITIDSHSYRSPNHERRTMKIMALLIHTGEGTRESDLKRLTDGNPPAPLERVSSHYYVCRNGAIYQLVNDERVAWHAGLAYYSGIADWNQASIGIETEHRKGSDWPQIQRDALAELCRDLIQQYNIPQHLVTTHRQVALPRGRKVDPTDWTDAEFYPWVASLYAVSVDVWQSWGDKYRLPEDQRSFAIPQTWLNYRNKLGEARSDEIYIDTKTALRSFEKGLIMWEVQGGQITVIDRQGQHI